MILPGVCLLGRFAAYWRESAAKNTGISTKGDQPPLWYAVLRFLDRTNYAKGLYANFLLYRMQNKITFKSCNF